MGLFRIAAAALVLTSTQAVAQEDEFRLRCEGKIERGDATTEAQLDPFSIEFKKKSVQLVGLDALDRKFTLIQTDEQFLVFKNGARTQGGNINRPTGRLYLYAVDKNAHKVTIAVNGLCVKED